MLLVTSTFLYISHIISPINCSSVDRRVTKNWPWLHQVKSPGVSMWKSLGGSHQLLGKAKSPRSPRHGPVYAVWWVFPAQWLVSSHCDHGSTIKTRINQSTNNVLYIGKNRFGPVTGRNHLSSLPREFQAPLFSPTNQWEKMRKGHLWYQPPPMEKTFAPSINQWMEPAKGSLAAKALTCPETAPNWATQIAGYHR